MYLCITPSHGGKDCSTSYMKTTLRFPEKFLWGAACASYQVEGGIENCDWAVASREGRVPVCGVACDHYNRYEQDFDIIQKLGHNAHRLSIEWARIEPEEGTFDTKEVEHYRNVIGALRARGLEPFVTLWHFTQPTWFSDDGGFEHRGSAERFRRYVEFVTKEILVPSGVTFVQTINEPMVWAGNGYLRGVWAPFKKNWLSHRKVIHNMIRAHKSAYRAIKEIKPELQVSIAKNNMYFPATNRNPWNMLRSKIMCYLWNRHFLDHIEHELDFIGLNFYKTHFFGPKPVPAPARSDMGWEICPEGLYHVLKELGAYGRPVYITENGLADAGDIQRKKYIVDHLAQVHRAIQSGVDVRGYFYWSLLDNYEWAEGFTKRFGLIEIDFVTQERKIRPSAIAYKEICETNVVELEP